MKRNTLLFTFFFTIITLSFLIPPLFPASAQATASQSSSTAVSNCVVTKIGTPIGEPVLPPECAAGPIAQKAVELARAQIGKPYVWGAPPGRNWNRLEPNTPNEPPSYDCSGLTGWAWYWASNGKISMDGQTNEDWKDAKGRGNTRYQKFIVSDLTKLKPPFIQPGDLIYWGTTSNTHHTAIFSGACKESSGNDCFIEAQKTGVPIKESHLRAGIVGFLRPVLQ